MDYVFRVHCYNIVGVSDWLDNLNLTLIFIRDKKCQVVTMRHRQRRIDMAHRFSYEMAKDPTWLENVWFTAKFSMHKNQQKFNPWWTVKLLFWFQSRSYPVGQIFGWLLSLNAFQPFIFVWCCFSFSTPLELNEIFIIHAKKDESWITVGRNTGYVGKWYKDKELARANRFVQMTQSGQKVMVWASVSLLVRKPNSVVLWPFVTWPFEFKVFSLYCFESEHFLLCFGANFTCDTLCRVPIATVANR